MAKTVLVAGGSDGLGKLIAAQLKNNYRVVILGRTQSKTRQVAEELGVDYHTADVSDYKQVREAVRKIIEKHLTIEALINSAGIWAEGELDEHDPETLRRVVEVNTLGTINLTKAVIPYMKHEKNGLIINIISQAGLYAKAERSVYNASKWALTGFTRSLDPELAPYGISVSGVYPGKLSTTLFAKRGVQKDLSDALEPEYVAQAIEFMLSMPRHVVFSEVGIKRLGN